MGSQSNGLSNRTKLGVAHFLHPEPSLLPSWLKSSTNRTMFEFGAVGSCWELLGLRRCHNNAATTMQSVHSAFSKVIFHDCTSMNDLVMVNFAKATNLLENWTAQ